MVTTTYKRFSDLSSLSSLKTNDSRKKAAIETMEFPFFPSYGVAMRV